MSYKFHNPYNFIPTPPRSSKRDHVPVGHNLYVPGFWSGRLRVTMTTITPLLIPDAGSADEIYEKQHTIYPLRIGVDGMPHIAPSSVKGMLRGAFEAITNSRFGVFNQDKRLARRMPAAEGLSLVPARIEDDKIVLYKGSTDGLPSAGTNGRWTVPGPQYAAWLPRYPTPMLSTAGDLPGHGDEVHCWIELFQHHRWDRFAKEHRADFKFWRVRALSESAAGLGLAPLPTAGLRPDWRDDKVGRSCHEPLRAPLQQVRGYVCIGNQNIKGKHDERVMFLDPSVTRIEISLSDQHRAAWHDLIASYQGLHERDLEERRRQRQLPDQYLGDEPGRTAYSRHVYTLSDRELDNGTLCYARITQSNGAFHADALYPVMISRQLSVHAPLALLDPSLQPATDIRQLSYADRVFGWVKQGTAGRLEKLPVAYRGQLRVGPIVCEHADITDFGLQGLPLANLSTPKPQQARFYVGQADGNPMADGTASGDAGFGYHTSGNRLRGRKVYPFHKGLDQGYWLNSQDQDGKIREFVRVDGIRNSQNRSVRGWVQIGARFSFDLWVTNLSRFEMGALLWLLQLPPDHHLSLGGGKPLGFGAIRLDVDLSHTELHTGDAVARRYESLETSAERPNGNFVSSTSPTGGYMRAIVKSYGDTELLSEDSDQVTHLFESVSFIKAFLRAASGHPDGLPVHYPRHTPIPHSKGENYKWFTANEAQNGPKLALARLDIDSGLPLQG